MRIGKAQPALGQRINIGRLDFASPPTITVHISDTEIVRKDEDNVRARRGVHGAHQHLGQEKLVSHEFVKSKAT